MYMEMHASVQSLHAARRFHAHLKCKTCLNTWKHCLYGAPVIPSYAEDSYRVFKPSHAMSQRSAIGHGDEQPCSSGSSEENFIAIEVDPAMVDALRRWRDVYKKAVIPKSVRDGQVLSQWMSSMRRLRKSLTEEQVKELDDAGMVWKMNTIESKWFANFHILREFKEEHEITRIDAYFGHDDPKDDAWDTLLGTGEQEDCDTRNAEARLRTSELIEASRWLHRQHSLYRKQKLNAMQVHLLKRVLGAALHRQHGPKRRNIHQKILQANDTFLSQQHQ